MPVKQYELLHSFDVRFQDLRNKQRVDGGLDASLRLALLRPEQDVTSPTPPEEESWRPHLGTTKGRVWRSVRRGRSLRTGG